jgi:5-(hydroxymethyl)furfural/furfural oxidase
MSNTGIAADETFDVIIAGAGPAGCALASRLSEDSDRQILLIDAGPDVVPGAEHRDLLDPFAVMAAYNSAFQWPGLVAEAGADRGNGSARASGPYVQARCIGGASNINGMGADRGQPGDYDEWARLGADGWEWSNVLPYFRKLEHDLDFADGRTMALHGDSGPMPVRRLPRARWAPFAATIGGALQRRGFVFLDDYMGDPREGFAAAPTNCLADGRVSASTAYLRAEVRRRPNLKILANTRVDRLSLDGLHANGVIACVGNTARLIRGRQIVVSCGAIRSPALLMLSGIGPAEHLTRHGIRVVRNLPGVGANLQNHPAVSLAMHLPRQAMQGHNNPWLLQNWLRFSSYHAGCESNDMHLMPFNRCDWHELGGRVGAVVLTVLKSYSRGVVRLSSSDPAVAPEVRFNLLADARDFERLVSGLRFMLQLLTDPLVARMRNEIFVPNGRLVASLNPRNAWNSSKAWTIARALDSAPLRRALLGESIVDPEVLLSEDSKLRELVLMLAHPQYHVCGTARMGRRDNPDAVVDGTGRVHGVEGIRVVDASIFPTIPRGYTHFPVIMAAEKIADAIKSELRRRCVRHAATEEART